MEAFLLNLDTYLLFAAAGIGACAVAARGLEPLVKLTKTEKDDAILAKVNTVLDKLQVLLAGIGSLKTPKQP